MSINSYTILLDNLVQKEIFVIKRGLHTAPLIVKLAFVAKVLKFYRPYRVLLHISEA